jgi:hypothetical protein
MDMDDIVKVHSLEGESLKIKRVKATGIPVERWLFHLQENTCQAVKKSIKEALQSYKEESEDFKRIRWVMENISAQALAVVDSIIWCQNTD